MGNMPNQLLDSADICLHLGLFREREKYFLSSSSLASSHLALSLSSPQLYHLTSSDWGIDMPREAPFVSGPYAGHAERYYHLPCAAPELDAAMNQALICTLLLQ